MSHLGEEEQISHSESNKEQPDDQKRCIVCETVPDSIICLACNHDIDIPCAAREILSSQDLNVTPNPQILSNLV